MITIIIEDERDERLQVKYRWNDGEQLQRFVAHDPIWQAVEDGESVLVKQAILDLVKEFEARNESYYKYLTNSGPDIKLRPTNE